MPHPRPYAPEKAAALAERRERDGLALLEEAAAWISGEGAGVVGSHYREGEPRREITRLAGELGVGLIMVGRREIPGGPSTRSSPSCGASPTESTTVRPAR